MATSMANLSRSLCRTFLSNPKFSQISRTSFWTFNRDPDSEDSTLNSNADSDPDSASAAAEGVASEEKTSEQRLIYDRPLENGLDVGIYKAILVGQVGQSPLQKRLKSGRTVTMFSMMTGGIRNNRRPLENEDPKEYANRCAVQWHRVSVYPERLGELVMKNVAPGSIMYLEGNLETKVFTDPITGLVRRIREIAIRRNGRVVFLANGSGKQQQASSSELKGVGYF